MSNSRIYDKTYSMLSNALDISARRHNLIAGNISNMNTIGYKPVDLDFNSTLKKSMEAPPPPQQPIMSMTNSKHFPGINDLYEPFSIKEYISESVDINHLDSVDIDTEMNNIAENNIKYRTATEMLLRKMTLLKHSIQEGGR
ncbi:MAG: flagellar basal body rod protein FlgB [Desulfamplus sp.]|nr:flagellar basal body rod protein FlgB [Desulfamplus sp.]